MVIGWALLSGGGENCDLASRLLDHPLRALYEMRESASRLITPLKSEDVGLISLKQHLMNVFVRYGEKRATRGNEEGVLSLDEPAFVVKIRKGRRYR
jgi:hypothetical protein